LRDATAGPLSLRRIAMHYDVVVIGAGLSGLTAASLLAKRGLHVAVIDRSYMPGGSCGVFKRNGITFDQGAAMLSASERGGSTRTALSSTAWRSRSM
jgi:phytoene dehydrogenase-like protein